MSRLHWLQRWWTLTVPADPLGSAQDRTEPLPASREEPPMLDHVVIAPTPLPFPERTERDVEWRRPVVMDDRQVEFGQLRVDRGVDGTTVCVPASHRDDVELDEEELEL